jgi:hypothetical protein
MRRVMDTSLLQQAARNGFIVAGLLLSAVGVGDMLAGRAKWHEYHTLLAEAPPDETRAPAALFPTSTEARGHRVVAEAKLAFYELLFLVGQLLAIAGVLLVGIGIARQRARTLRTLPASARFH